MRHGDAACGGGGGGGGLWLCLRPYQGDGDACGDIVLGTRPGPARLVHTWMLPPNLNRFHSPPSRSPRYHARTIVTAAPKLRAPTPARRGLRRGVAWRSVAWRGVAARKRRPLPGTTPVARFISHGPSSAPRRRRVCQPVPGQLALLYCSSIYR